MFDLEKAIGEWRHQMGASGVNSAEVLNELESHLRDEIENLIHSGCSERSAFQGAIDRIGDAASLQAEFAKGGGQGTTSTRFLKGSYRIAAVFVLGVNTWTLLAHELNPTQRGFAIITIAIISWYLAFLPALLERLPTDRLSLPAALIKVTTNLVWLWPIIALLDSTQVLHLGLGILPATLVWCLYTAVVMTVVAFGLIHGSKPDRGGSPPPSFQSQPMPRPRWPLAPADLFTTSARATSIDPLVQQCVESARNEASRLGHSFIGTEHLLLALLKGAEGSFAILLRKLGLSSQAVRGEIEKLISPAVPASTARNALTPRAQKAIRLAGREAKAMNHSAIEAADLLIGLLREGSGIGARALRNLGVGIEGARAEILRASHAR